MMTTMGMKTKADRMLLLTKIMLTLSVCLNNNSLTWSGKEGISEFSLQSLVGSPEIPSRVICRQAMLLEEEAKRDSDDVVPSKCRQSSGQRECIELVSNFLRSERNRKGNSIGRESKRAKGSGEGERETGKGNETDRRERCGTSRNLFTQKNSGNQTVQIIPAILFIIIRHRESDL